MSNAPSRLFDDDTDQLVEEGGRADVGGLVVPGEHHRLWAIQVAPQGVPLLQESTAPISMTNR